jgi:hypothetical protein
MCRGVFEQEAEVALDWSASRLRRSGKAVTPDYLSHIGMEEIDKLVPVMLGMERHFQVACLCSALGADNPGMLVEEVRSFEPVGSTRAGIHKTETS